MVCFSDAFFANLKRGGLQEGLLVFLQERNGKYVISLVDKKAKESSQKYLNCRSNWSNIMVKTMLLEILNVDAYNQILLVKCVTDSKSLHDAVYPTKT